LALQEILRVSSCALRTRLPMRPLQWLAAAAALLLLTTSAAGAVAVRRLDWTFVTPDPQAVANNADGSPGAPSSTFDLPLHWSTLEGSPLHTVAMRLHFDLSTVPDQPWAILLSHYSEGGRFSVNGKFIGAISAESDQRHVAWRRPQMLTLDPALLVAGDNQILIEATYGPGVHTIAGVEVGPLGELWNGYARLYFCEIVWTWSGATIALLAALVLGALWLQRREPVPLFLAAAALFWLGYCGAWLTEVMPIGLRLSVNLIAMTGLAAFLAAISISLMRMSGLSRRREEWLIGIYAALGPAMALGTGLRALPYLLLSWQPGLYLIPAAAIGVGLYRRTRGLAAPHPLALAGAAALVGGALLDLGGALGLDAFDGAHFLNYVAPLVLVALAAPLIDGLIRTMHETEAARVELETRVREREQLLKRNFERLRESERIKVESQERQRIMQDMHDGLGSQLMSALMLVERGAVSNDQFAQILRESIDDMRLAIDALTAEDADLTASLGNLRFRMEPRLRAAGMELAWDARHLPEEIGLDPDVVLPILRIVQEALTNALKHSRAQAVRVVLMVEGAGDARMLDIRIADNGAGISEERVGGRGLLNMRNRAQKIGAQFKVETAANVGTTVHLRFRIGPALPNTRSQQTALNTQAIIEHARRN
jgi:signal transduction histidine kinase